MENNKILFVEDAPEAQILIKSILKDYQITCCSSLEQAKHELPQGPFTAIILDIELPDGDGLRFLAECPETLKANAAVFIISGKASLANKAMAFNYGADDFIQKPFDPLELKMRLEAKIRKLKDQEKKTENFQIEDLFVNVAEQRLYIEETDKKTPISLTSLEFRIFAFLSKNKNMIISRDEIINHIWGNRVHVIDRTVDAHIAHIRKKICRSKVKIETIFGSGYKLIFIKN